MSFIRLITASSLMLILSACADKSSQEHAHTDTQIEHSEHAVTHEQDLSQTPNRENAEKFVADEKLSQYMKDIHLNFGSLQQAGSESEVKETGQKMEATVQDIFKNCKLAPDADAAAHPILAEILAGTTLLKSGEKDAGMKRIDQALQSYQLTFK